MDFDPYMKCLIHTFSLMIQYQQLNPEKLFGAETDQVLTSNSEDRQKLDNLFSFFLSTTTEIIG